MQNKATDYKLDVTSDLHRWRAFVAISELGSLTRAALFLDTNQSLLSRQLNKLERDCGARLFNRTGRGVELSEAGQAMIEPVRALLVCSPAGLEDFFAESMALLERLPPDTTPADELKAAQKALRDRFGLLHIGPPPEDKL